jgi:hypothetical protein
MVLTFLLNAGFPQLTFKFFTHNLNLDCVNVTVKTYLIRFVVVVIIHCLSYIPRISNRQCLFFCNSIRRSSFLCVFFCLSIYAFFYSELRALGSQIPISQFVLQIAFLRPLIHFLRCFFHNLFACSFLKSSSILPLLFSSPSLPFSWIHCPFPPFRAPHFVSELAFLLFLFLFYLFFYVTFFFF